MLNFVFVYVEVMLTVFFFFFGDSFGFFNLVKEEKNTSMVLS